MYWILNNKKIEYGNKILLMGIVNITPDSFSDGGQHFSVDSAVDYALELIGDGADIIDLGAQSTRPGFTQISAEEEWQRLAPVLEILRGKTDIPISVDTFYPEVAEKALEKGADIINDVSGNVTLKMAKIVKKWRCGWILTHNGSGTPSDIKCFFTEATRQCINYGIDQSQLCFDMGIGFGKTFEEDLALIANVKEYKPENAPLLLGVSRKRVIGRGSGQDDPEKRIYGNIAADTVAVLGGVNIIRLHDIKNEKQGIRMAEKLKVNGEHNE